MNRNKDWRYSCFYFSCLLKKKCWCLCFPGCRIVCKMPGACDKIWRQTVVHWLQKCAGNVPVRLSVWEIQTFNLSLCCRSGLFTAVHATRACWYSTWSSVESSWNVLAHSDAREGKWRGNSRMQWVSNTPHTTLEHGVSSITTADAHASAASSRLKWCPRRFKWTRPFRRKKKFGFCACAITFQTQSTFAVEFRDLLKQWWHNFRCSVRQLSNLYSRSCAENFYRYAFCRR
jgi:hypothetical protein